MEQAEKIFWIKLSLVGAIFITIFGTGLGCLFFEDRYISGSALTVWGLVGAIYLVFHLRDTCLKRTHFALGIGTLLIVIACLGYDIFYPSRHRDTTALQSGQRNALISWGWGAGRACSGIVDGNRIIDQSDQYRVALICGFADSTLDHYDDKRITVTNAFRITPSEIELSAHYSRIMGNGLDDLLDHAVKNMRQEKPKTSSITVPFVWWYAAVLLPINLQPTDIHCLADVARLGGKVVGEQTMGGTWNKKIS
jgi:hypothetical protein